MPKQPDIPFIKPLFILAIDPQAIGQHLVDFAVNDYNKDVLKRSDKHQRVLNALLPHIEAQDTPEADAPVRACYRYITNRCEQLDYKRAIEQELPIGSEEIESAHRYVMQKRLKLAGAWWTVANAEHMIQLRTCRANQRWKQYWKSVA